jgi:effector-binding domain-containing protein
MADKQGNGRGRRLAYGAVGALAVLGAGWFLYREKSVEKPNYRLVEEDGEFEIREYPELVVAETVVQGGREHGLDQGFARLADYIFARHREGEKVAMTAPVLSSAAPGGGWLTRFVMPAHYTRDSLPEPDSDIRIATMPARRVAALRFHGGPDSAALAAREAQLTSWVGAKKLRANGPAERAFYNSPRIPGPLRRAEVLIPIE